MKRDEGGGPVADLGSVASIFTIRRGETKRGIACRESQAEVERACVW